MESRPRLAAVKRGLGSYGPVKGWHGVDGGECGACDESFPLGILGWVAGGDVSVGLRREAGGLSSMAKVSLTVAARVELQTNEPQASLVFWILLGS